MKPLPIGDVAARLGLGMTDFEPVGWHKAKLALDLATRLEAAPRARYIGVTAVHPTPVGEGKTVVAIGLAMALSRRGHQSIVALRQPSQGPVFGIKGGGAGGGAARLLPADDINLHFTGDIHAATAANNLLAAIVDNHVRRRKIPLIEPQTVTWRRALDVNDKGLAHIITGLDHVPQAPLRETGFDLTAASEVMAILAMARDLADLRLRLGQIVVGETASNEIVRAEDIGCAGAMAALLRDAVRPNLVQTCEHTPALVHAGPFGNIAHGNSSIVADRLATRMADFVVTESGFGSDCGAEKFFSIKCRASGLVPTSEVIVCTIRALKLQSGRFDVRPGKPLPPDLLREDLDALEAGLINLEGHIDVVRTFGVPVVVAVNRFPGDTDRELQRACEFAASKGARVAICDAFARGGEGALELAETVEASSREAGRFTPLYDLAEPLEAKLDKVACGIYGADGVDFEPAARRRIERLTELGYGGLPVCVAKTQYSFSHDPKRLGRPRGFRLPIREVRLFAGAGYVQALAGDIQTMPGLPLEPAAMHIDVDADGVIRGM